MLGLSRVRALIIFSFINTRGHVRNDAATVAAAERTRRQEGECTVAPPSALPKVELITSIRLPTPQYSGVPLPVFPINPVAWHSSL